MIEYAQISEKNINLKYTSSNIGGNYVLYFKLFIQLCEMLKKEEFKQFSLGYKIKTYLMIIFKTPWWLLIKPLGCLFTIKRIYQGNFYCKFKNSNLYKTDFSDMSKTTKIVLLNTIPLWFFKTKKLSKADESLIIEKYAYSK